MTSLSRKETIAALGPVKPAIAARTAIPQLSHIFFDGAYVYAFNGGLGIKAKFQSPLKCGVPGGLFLGLLNQASADQVEFEYADNVINFKAGRAKITMNTLALDQRVWRYPDKIAGKPKASIKITDDFIKGLKRVLSFRPSDPKRMEHHSVCIYREGDAGDEMDLYVTDSIQLLVAPVAEQIGGKLDKLALPRELAEQIVAQCAPGEDLQMFDDYFVVKANAEVTLFSNVLDTSDMLDIPGVASRLSDDKTAPPFAIPDGIKATLERAVLMSGGEDPIVTLVASGKALKLSGSYKHGDVAEEFTLAKAMPKASVKLDGKSLISALEGAKKLALSVKAVNLRDDAGFMHIMAAQGEPPRQVEAAPEEE